MTPLSLQLTHSIHCKRVILLVCNDHIGLQWIVKCLPIIQDIQVMFELQSTTYNIGYVPMCHGRNLVFCSMVIPRLVAVNIPSKNNCENWWDD